MPAQITSVKWTAQNIPSGLTLDEATGTFSGTATEVGEYIVPVTVETNYGTDTKDVSLNITSDLQITTKSLAKATNYSDYSQQMELNRTGDYYWEAEGLPDGLEIGYDTGLISGKPKEHINASTVYPVTVKVYNSSWEFRTEKNYNLHVASVILGHTGGTTLEIHDIYYVFNNKFTLKEVPEEGEISFTITGLPPGVNIYSETDYKGKSLDRGVVQIAGVATEENLEDKIYNVEAEAFIDGEPVAYRGVSLTVRGMYPHLYYTEDENNQVVAFPMKVISSGVSDSSMQSIYTPTTIGTERGTQFYIIHGMSFEEGVSNVDYRFSLSDDSKLEILYGSTIDSQDIRTSEKYSTNDYGDSLYCWPIFTSSGTKIYDIRFCEPNSNDKDLTLKVKVASTTAGYLLGEHSYLKNVCITGADLNISTNWGTLTLPFTLVGEKVSALE